MAKKPKGPKFEDLRNTDALDLRTIQVHRETVERPSSRVIFFDCPYCSVEVKAYVWSLTGGGKRCECGALFTGISGNAAHFKDRCMPKDCRNCAHDGQQAWWPGPCTGCGAHEEYLNFKPKGRVLERSS